MLGALGAAPCAAPVRGRARRLNCTCAKDGKKAGLLPQPQEPLKKPPTRKRMMEALLREARLKQEQLAQGPPAPAAKRKPSPKPAPIPVEADEEGEILDLTAFLGGESAPAAAAAEEEGGDEEGTADSFGGVILAEEGETLELDEASFLMGEPPPPKGLVNSWTWDSDVGELVFAQVPQPPSLGGFDAKAGGIGALLARLERGESLDEEDEFYTLPGGGDEDDDEETDADDDRVTVAALERRLPPQLRTPTALQRVDVGDTDAVIGALAALDTAFLDKESAALLAGELERKTKERAKLQKRVAETSTAPPEGKRRTHRQLAVIAGSAQNYKLWSPTDMNTRPMMAAVRGAVFSMLTSLSHGNGQTGGTFAAGQRWLDLFAGTGAVGIEALSRGCVAAHFVELDPWTVTNCLRRNLEHTRTAPGGTVHATPVEAFLAAAAADPALRLAGGAPFDFVSVCPPYEKVSYAALLASLEASPLVQTGTLLVVEYPKYERKTITDEIGRLEKIRDRAYGRTLVAVYEARDAQGDTPRRQQAAAEAAAYEADLAAGRIAPVVPGPAASRRAAALRADWAAAAEEEEEEEA